MSPTEKMIRAKILLEETLKKKRCSDRCITELDPEGYAPCNCGASSARSSLQEAIKLLSID